MPAFVQIIEFQTSRIDEVRALGEEFRAEREADPGPGPVVRGTYTADRDRPGTYVSIVEFASYEDAMRNSSLPSTSRFAERMAALCDGQPRFYNLDVLDTFAPVPAQQRQAQEEAVRT